MYQNEENFEAPKAPEQKMNECVLYGKCQSDSTYKSKTFTDSDSHVQWVGKGY